MFDRDEEFEKVLKAARLDNWIEKWERSKSTTTPRESNAYKEEGEVATTRQPNSLVTGKTTKEAPTSRHGRRQTKAKDVLETYRKNKKRNHPLPLSIVLRQTKEHRQLRRRKQIPVRISILVNNGTNLLWKRVRQCTFPIWKKESIDRGISTASFFEKSDLVDAYANAVADNIERINMLSPTNNYNDNNNSDNGFDPSYNDVIMHTFDPRLILSGDVIIDISAETVR